MFYSMRAEQVAFQNHYAQLRDGDALIPVSRLLQRAAEQYGSVNALICGNATITYYALYRRALAFSDLLRTRGVQPGDRILLFFENSIEFYIGYYGILQVGAIVAPLNVFLHDQELAHIIEDAQPSAIVVSQTLKARVPQAPHRLLLTQEDMPLDCTQEQYKNFLLHERNNHELVALLYTSGTTGAPKGVMLSSHAIMTNVMQALSRFDPPKVGDRIFGVLPLFHSFAQNICVWIAFAVGCTVIVVPHIERRAILEHLVHQPTYFLGVPALYGLLCMLRVPQQYLQHVKMFVCGGDALPDKIKLAFMLLYGRRIVVGYGLTEASPVVSAEVDDIAIVSGAVGRPLWGIDVRIVDEQGRSLSQGVIGELHIKGENLMLGYYNAPEATAQVMQDGWLLTGDLAYVDKEGRIILTGRAKDLIIHKGFNIYPQEIENVIMSYANVMRVAVIGRSDHASGEIPVAYVQLRQEEVGVAQKLGELCRVQLAAYKIPRAFMCTTEPLPITATGKIDKKVLKKRETERRQ